MAQLNHTCKDNEVETQNIRELKKHESDQCYKLRGHVANLHESPFDQSVSISKRRSRTTNTPVIRTYTESFETGRKVHIATGN